MKPHEQNEVCNRCCCAEDTAASDAYWDRRLSGLEYRRAMTDFLALALLFALVAAVSVYAFLHATDLVRQLELMHEILSQISSDFRYWLE